MSESKKRTERLSENDNTLHWPGILTSGCDPEVFTPRKVEFDQGSVRFVPKTPPGWSHEKDVGVVTGKSIVRERFGEVEGTLGIVVFGRWDD